MKKLYGFLKVAGLLIAGSFCVELLAGSGDSGGVKDAKTISGMADNMKDQMKSIGELMIATAQVAGVGFTMGSIFKFKQHKDNPTQVQIGTPFALLAIGLLLMFLPGLFKPAAKSIYGGDVEFGKYDGAVDSGKK